ncbi:hypothetical protein HTZ77_15885 [Nonomuraea sp. SMC257]|uniref:Uncharacterized protein n=1 Tax=Nonomuraea montanisoli TaxID=2741721 RepID=A0A7Y6I9L4_9ACTN|nr:hypothetical protein [Nonomuraea montanisoli]NUW32904.1 hypothetical protein [Nonomuraea montanisoli]
MTRQISALADRMVNAVVPKATAHAIRNCYSISCYCSGPRLYKKTCCDLEPCGPCYYVGLGC